MHGDVLADRVGDIVAFGRPPMGTGVGKTAHEFHPSLDEFTLPPLDLGVDVEGFGIVFIEANAAGVPVVAARTGGVSDAVQEGISGVFADPMDPDSIAEAIKSVALAGDEMRVSARQWSEKFSVTQVGLNLSAVYRKVVGLAN